MAKEEEMEKVKALIHMGKKKGFLTYDEVNTLLPPDIISSDQIDDLMMMFGEMDIEVVDAAHKVKVSKQREEVEPLPPEEELELEAEGLGKSIDPVYMYLREMGSVSLLTREGEVEIAKRIETGEKEVINAVLDSPLTIKEIIQLGERLRSKKVKPKELAPDQEDEDESFWEEEFNVQRILTLIDQIRKFDEKNPGVGPDPAGEKAAGEQGKDRLSAQGHQPKNQTDRQNRAETQGAGRPGGESRGRDSRGSQPRDPAPGPTPADSAHDEEEAGGVPQVSAQIQPEERTAGGV